MQILYPPIKTYAQHILVVQEPHSLYVEEAGNPDGIPVLVVHGGPGAGSDSHQRRFFDPDKYRIILFDQRGSGKSTPHAELKNNNTQALLEDMETIRTHLNIKQWVLFGSTWGSALSLLYAQKHPQNVRGLILHSIFLARRQDIDWFYKHGANIFFPDYWEEFIQILSPDEKNDIINAYHQRLSGKDEIARMNALKNWSLWQARCNSLQPKNQITEQFSDLRFSANLASLETYYLINNCFIEDNLILNQMDTLKNIPCFIIHGRYDILCPLEGAWELHKNWPGSQLFIVREAGHSMLESTIIDAIVLASQQMIKAAPKVS